MTIFVAVIAGLATWFVVSIVLAVAQGYLRGMGGMATVVLTYQPYKIVIQVVCWVAAIWAGFSVFDRMDGM